MMMKAAIYYQFNGPIQIESVPAPTTCCCRRHDDDGVHIISISIGMVIQVMATGVCRSDWHGWKGHDADIRQHGLPFCPGHEFAGIVVEMSNSCTGNESSSGSGSSSSSSSGSRRRRRRRGIQIGDRVVVPFLLSCGTCRYCQAGRSTVCTRQQQPGFTYWGSFAEYVAIPQDRLQHVYVLPDAVSFVQAAALGCRFTTAYRAVLQQGNWEGILLQQQKQQQQELPASMAVFGCGGVGLSCIMIAAAAAAKANADHHNNKKKRQPTIAIIAVDISQAALNKATSLGATHAVLIHPQDSHEDVLQQVLQCLQQQQQHHHHQNDATVCTRSSNRSFKNVGITEVDGVDLAIDAAGFASTCEHAVYCTRCAGRMVQVGLPIDGTNDDGDGNVDDDDDSTTSTIGKSKLPVVPMGRVAGREIEIYGSHGFVSTDLEPLLQMIASGKLDPARLVEKCVTLREGIQALQDMDRSSPLGITMITSFQETSKL